MRQPLLAAAGEVDHPPGGRRVGPVCTTRSGGTPGNPGRRAREAEPLSRLRRQAENKRVRDRYRDGRDLVTRKHVTGACRHKTKGRPVEPGPQGHALKHTFNYQKRTRTEAEAE